MQKTSEKLNEILTALSKFQGEVDNASKDKSGHGYKYADLANVINTAKPHLASNGLSVMQMINSNEQGLKTLITMLGHSSGQFISSEFVMVEANLMGGAGKNPAQVLGSAITYQRRYAYAAILGLAQEDDDGKNLTQAPKQQARNTGQQTPKPMFDINNKKLKERSIEHYKQMQSFDAIEANYTMTQGDKDEIIKIAAS